MRQMIEDIETEVRYTADMIGRHRLSDRVIDAMRRVPRHLFVDPGLLDEAYDNNPLPIGYGQTISQPYMVAVMTDLLELQPHQKILEVGFGSGYQAAVLSLLVKQVISLEIISPLADRAHRLLKQQGYHNVQVIQADGHFGWADEAPYDGIIVTAAPEEIPQPLIDQLAPESHLIIPVGFQGIGQQLMDVHKAKDGSINTRSRLGVRFVPLTSSTQPD
ncbi:protein-L-isoaspartate(D-aspartate) O-methyltransferase [Amphritea balenae]|uniref:Protein-L-isoaspartate O-methyltransferase n=1 Tax=Amphritea balenae TaxID=452629 RepID=A0A3P1SWE6_9GAMM|nr:protein-L-isoaspartate(D-aspartate) O-methyltransferase [Amphritea balenae]RRD01524.1 protein-L-isoaspartate(D-aspartate) O-methyltransferase [Amphritea balenae]GGK56294.1 protein-L-isoaspartate O-methyltransferase [Amphritea balenae]